MATQAVPAATALFVFCPSVTRESPPPRAPRVSGSAEEKREGERGEREEIQREEQRERDKEKRSPERTANRSRSSSPPPVEPAALLAA